jgi:quinoprotein glucose dehydrogenase
MRKNCLLRNHLALLSIFSVACLCNLARLEPAKAQEKTGPDPERERLVMGQFEKSADLKVSLLADSTKISHPIAFAVDDFGRVFVAESFRYIDWKGGWTDIRYRMPWMAEDLASRSIADRKKLYESRLGDELPEWQKASERVRLLEQPDEKGAFKKSTVFAQNFNSLLDGTIAGVLATRDKLYVTNIPSLWQLDGAQGDRETARQALHTGFGVRLGYLGHDLHGLCWGPDGRLYFSMGDRGARMEKDGKLLADQPDTGGVYRCEADGSNLELFAKGLRNPQELAFDAFGNLWTCDNNADRGDKARWVWVLPGGDSGWRVGYQHLNKPVPLGAWTSEKIWYPAHPEQSGHIVPPVANLAQGPSGVAAHPGTGVPVSYTGQFLVCDYLGDGGGVYAVNVTHKGAGFEMQPPGKFMWRTPANDIDFAPDGAVLFCTWTGGIGPDSGGGLYRVESPGLNADPLARSTSEILKLDPSKMELQVLGGWLNHPDMRVRRQAQFELVKRGKPAVQIFRDCIEKSGSQLGRVTSLWGLAQLQRLKNIPFPADWQAWAVHEDLETRATLARVLGETSAPGAEKVLIGMLNKNEHAHVKLWACLALGQLKSAIAFDHLKKLAPEAADPWLRHGLAVALAGCASSQQLYLAVADPSNTIRHLAVLALARQKSLDLSLFIYDRDISIQADVARGIYDNRIRGAQKVLAAMDIAGTLGSNQSAISREAIVRRWIQANLREGRAENARRLISLAKDNRFDEFFRLESLEALAHWANPPVLDGVQGLYDPIAPEGREPSAAKAEMQQEGDFFLARSQAEAVQLAMLQFLEVQPIEKYNSRLKSILEDKNRSATVQAKSLALLVKNRDPEAAQYVRVGLKSPQVDVKLAAISSVASLNPAERVPVLDTILSDGTRGEKQRAIGILYEISDQPALARLEKLVDDRVKGRLEPSLRLELTEAVHKLAQEGRGMRSRLEAQIKEETMQDPLARWRDTMAGGDAGRGKEIFLGRSDLSCVRCHQPANARDRVGPSLEEVGSRMTVEQIVQSIVTPNAQLAKGFETVVLALKDGLTVTGLLAEETPEHLVVRTAEGKQQKVARNQVEERAKGVSLMPEGLGERLSARDLRDLAAYLASQKSAVQSPGKTEATKKE